MPRRRKFLSTLDLGEVSPDFLHNAAEGFLARACKTALNIILKAGGGAMRRPGSRLLRSYSAQTRRYTFRGRGFDEYLVFGDGSVEILDEAGNQLQTITTDVPWAAPDLDKLHFDSNANSVFVFRQTFMVQELKRADSGLWSLSEFTFSPTVNGKVAQPYYDKFDEIDVTMSLNAYSGSSATLTFSDDVLVAGHVGTRFRYLTRCEVEIVSVTDAQIATVNIIDRLYPTLDLTVANGENFKPGQVVQGTLSDVQGIVVSANATTVRVILLEGYTLFTYDSSSAENSDVIVGPEGNERLTAAPVTVSVPATTSIWDEQLFSDVRGYPGTGVIHKKRLIMSSFANATDIIVGSARGNFNNFEVGANDEDAFNEELGADPNSQIRHVVSTEQLLMFTDRGIYFIPESAESPLTPTSLEFSLVGPDGASDVQPIVASEGVLFIDSDAGRLMAAAMTGNVRRPWAVAELSEAGYHHLTGPKRIVMANGLDGRTERYALVLNDDGTMACMMYRRGSETVGFSRWTHGVGTFEDVTAHEDEIITTSLEGGRYHISTMTFHALVDDERDYSSALTGVDGATVDIVENREVIGTGAVTSGVLEDIAPTAGLFAGFDFDVELTPAPQIDTERGWRRQRVTQVWVDVIKSGAFMVGTVEHLPYTATDVLGQTGFVRSGVIRSHQLGWTEDATRTVKQMRGRGALLDVRSITMEVAS